MLHAIGVRFTSIAEVRRRIFSLEKRWNDKIAPAIVQFAVDSGKEKPKSDELNGKKMTYCVTEFLT